MDFFSSEPVVRHVQQVESWGGGWSFAKYGETSDAFVIGTLQVRSIVWKGQMASASNWIRAKATVEGWPPQELALALLSLAMLTSNGNQEAVGLALLSDALANDLSKVPEIEVALNAARAQLSWHLGATHVGEKKWEMAFCQYLQAVQASIAGRMHELAR